MKKIVGTIAAIALAASSAFAATGIGAWGRGIWAPVASKGSDVEVFLQPGWEWAYGVDTQGNFAGSPGPRIGFSVYGSSDNIGFNVDITGENGGLGDTQFIWVKPWSFLELQVGKVQDNSSRGDGCFGAFNWIRNSTAAGLGEDLTFMRFGNGGGGQATGAIVKVTPIDGLWIEAAFDGFYGSKWAKAEDVYSKAQYGAGYDIAGIGHIRAQYIGVSKRINAAFDLKVIEALTLTVGAYIPLDKAVYANTDINAYAAYALDSMKFHALVAVGLDKDNKADIKAGVGADFDFGDGIGLVADIRMRAYDTNTSLSFLVGVSKGFSNGSLGIGFQGVTQTKNAFAGMYVADGSTFGWQIPVKLEYAF